MIIPEPLRDACAGDPTAEAWLNGLPDTLTAVVDAWDLEPDDPLSGAGTASWVSGVVLPDGTEAVLKLGRPHMEAEDEAGGLRAWDGEGMVRLIRHAPEHGALLLERLRPGTSLRTRPEEEQDEVLASLLRTLWRTPPVEHAFRPLSRMLDLWADEVEAAPEPRIPDDLWQAGIGLLRSLPRDGAEEVLLATDLHAGNVLAAGRAPWVGIDPKPFLGDRAYDATQHLLNCPERLVASPGPTVERFAGLLDVDPVRVRLWLFARLAAGTWVLPDPARHLSLVRALAP